MSRDAEKHPHARTEVQQGKGEHTNTFSCFSIHIYFHINQMYLLARFTYECDFFHLKGRIHKKKKKKSQPMKYYMAVYKTKAAAAKYNNIFLHFERFLKHLPLL